MRVAPGLSCVVMLAGCQMIAGIDDYPATLGAACSPTAVCGDGELCDFTAAGGPTCIVETEDSDADGIPDRLDHCLHMDGGESDEDNDGYGDICDRCPIAPPPASPEADGDDTDAPCDPDPTTPGDHVVAFDTFTQNTLGTIWQPDLNTSWSIANGAMSFDGTASSADALVRIALPASTTVAFQAAYRVRSVDSTSSSHRVGVGVERTGMPVKTACVTLRSDGMLDQLRAESATNGSVPLLPPAGTDVFSTTSDHRIAGYRIASGPECVFLAGATNAGTVPGAFDAGLVNVAWIEAHSTSIDVLWFLAVAR